MESHNIYITGLIGTLYSQKGDVEEKGVELIDVIQQVQQAHFAEILNVYINSEGGVFETGFEIYDYLTSLKKNGKIINTIGLGQVASIATVPYMAGISRKLKPNTKFLIHLPMIGLDGYMNSSDLENAKTELQPYEKKLISFYKEVTGLEEEAIAPLVKKETTMTPSQAFDLKFSTDEVLEFEKAVAYKKVNTNKIDMAEFKTADEAQGFINNLIAKAEAFLSKKDKPNNSKNFNVFAFQKKASILDVTLTDANGVVVDFPEVEEGTMPEIGAKALIDGSPAIGEYLMPDGSTFVFENGALKQIKPANSDENLTALKEELLLKEAEIQSNAGKISEKEGQITSLIEDVKELKKSIISSSFKPESTQNKKPKEGLSNAILALNNLKNKRK